MAILPILEYPDQRLRKRAKPVVTVDDDIKRLVDDMFETMENANGIGLSAPQIGLSINLFVIDLIPYADEDPSIPKVKQVFINPKILKLKIILVTSLIIVALLSIPIISLPGNNFLGFNLKFFKHALEWDYFIGVISFYLLTFFMWKKN